MPFPFFGSGYVIIFLAIFLSIVGLYKRAFGVRRKKHDIYLNVFTGQMLAVVKANLPILPSLKTLSYSGMKKSVRKIHGRIVRDLESGVSLSGAIKKHPRVFPEWYVGMVRAGEENGNLESVFEQISRHRDSMASFAKKVSWPIGYFLSYVLYMLPVVFFLNTFIIPKFMTIFKETGLPAVPEFHRIRFVLNVLPVFIGLLVILIFGFSFLRFVTRRIKSARLLVDWLSLRLPVMGGITKKVAIVRFSRTLSALFQSGVPVLMALNIVRNQETNTAIQRLYEQMNHGIKEGEGLATQLERTKFFPHTFVWMASVGEHSGKLEQALSDAADFYMLDADTHLGHIVSITLPVCVILAGIFVGTIIISMFSLLVRLEAFLLLGGI